MDGAAFQSFVALLNAQVEWTTDESMLAVIPARSREFVSQPDWSRLKALAYLHNNVAAMRGALQAIEDGEPLDLDQLNPILETIRLKAVIRTDPSGRGSLTSPIDLGPALVTDRMNLGTAWIRWTVQRAAYDLVRYAQHRRADPVYPASTPFRLRVLPCSRPACHRLTTSASGQPSLCTACATG